jgi:hypothetical protein
LDSFAFFQNALVYGSTYLHVDPPSQCPGQSPLLFTSACVGSSPADCATVQNGVMQRGLATALTNYMTTARALLDSVAFTQSTSPSLLMTWATLNATLNSPDMMGLRAMERAYLYPPLLQSSKLYSIKATDQLAAVEPVRVTLLCAFIAYADDARGIQCMFGFSTCVVFEIHPFSLSPFPCFPLSIPLLVCTHTFSRFPMHPLTLTHRTCVTDFLSHTHANVRTHVCSLLLSLS